MITNMGPWNRLRVLKLMPYFVMSFYFMDAFYSTYHFRNVGKERAVVMDVSNAFGCIYTIFDIGTIVMSLILILGTSIEESGVTLLLIGRVVHRLLFSIWSMLFYFLLSDALDLGCLLMLLAAKTKVRLEMGWPKMEVSSYHLLLAGARICLCCMFAIWLDEDMNVPFNVLSVCLLIPISVGFQCKWCSYLTVLALLYHDVFSNHWSMLWGWRDNLLSLQYFAIFFGKIGAFLILSELGGGKWSVDGYMGWNGNTWDQKGSYKILKGQTTA